MRIVESASRSECVHEHEFQIMMRRHNLGAEKVPGLPFLDRRTSLCQVHGMRECEFERARRQSCYCVHGAIQQENEILSTLGLRNRGESGTRKAIAEGDDLIEEVVVGLLGCLRELNLAN